MWEGLTGATLGEHLLPQVDDGAGPSGGTSFSCCDWTLHSGAVLHVLHDIYSQETQLRPV